MNYILKISLLLALILVFSCKPEVAVEEKEKPSIPTETMVKMSAEIQLAEAFIQDANMKKDSLHKHSIEELYSFVLKKYNIEQSEYDKNLNFYLKHPDEMKDLYSRIKEELLKLEAQN